MTPNDVEGQGPAPAVAPARTRTHSEVTDAHQRLVNIRSVVEVRHVRRGRQSQDNSVSDGACTFVAAEMETAQSDAEQAAKGRGQQNGGSQETASHAHGGLRLTQAFDAAEMVSEFRALRASVIRLWFAQPEASEHGLWSELIRFNEAVDQILAESINRYASEMERSRELLLAALGHDLRSPLSSTRMSAEVLARTSLEPRQTQLTATIISGSERIRKMVYDLLDFTGTRLGAKLALTLGPRDLDAVCRNIAEETRSGHPDRVISVTSSGNCVGQWDCERVAQLVSNLIGNSSVPTLFEQDQLFIGNALDVVGHGLCK